MNKIKAMNVLSHQIDLLYKQFLECSDEAYLCNIYSSISGFDNLYDILFNKSMINWKKLIINHFSKVSCARKMTKINEKKFVDNFIDNKDYHKDFFMDIFEYLCDTYYELYGVDYFSDDTPIDILTSIDRKRYNDITFNYFNECDENLLNLYEEKLKDRIFENNDIFDCSNYSFEGRTLFDMYNNDYFIFLLKNKHTINDIFTLVHELGHVEYFNMLYNKYFNELYNIASLSSFKEVNSLYKEESLYHYLIENNLQLDDLKLILRNRLSFQIDSITNLLVLSSLDDEIIRKEEYSNVLYADIGELFIDSNLFFANLNLYDDVNYTYGFILGMYFKDNVDKYEYFMKRGYSLFNQKYIENLGITSNNIISTYHKDLTNYKRYF